MFLIKQQPYHSNTTGEHKQKLGNDHHSKRGKKKERDYSLMEVAVAPHEAPAPARMSRSGLVSPGGHLARAEYHRRAVWAALTQGGGQ